MSSFSSTLKKCYAATTEFQDCIKTVETERRCESEETDGSFMIEEEF
jgi:hypothetical protein